MNASYAISIQVAQRLIGRHIRQRWRLQFTSWKQVQYRLPYAN